MLKAESRTVRIDSTTPDKSGLEPRTKNWAAVRPYFFCRALALRHTGR